MPLSGRRKPAAAAKLPASQIRVATAFGRICRFKNYYLFVQSRAWQDDIELLE